MTTHVCAYLFKNSLKVVLKLLETPSLDAETKAKIKAELEAMLRMLDTFGSK